MNDTAWQKLKHLFAAAREMPAERRLEFLTKECNGDERLLHDVLSLLGAEASGEPVIETHAIDLAARLMSSADGHAGRRFGNYRIIREIGSGGMGTVFLAERDDGEFAMQVALKVVRQSLADSAIIERFRRERQILAGLRHTNIAALYDGGVSDRGEPYLAMEYVEGETLVDYCEQQQLNIEEKLALFLKVCSAIAYAHSNLVVHRDIKPTNLLVTADGEPKLLDFGLAKAFEADAEKTQTEMRAFTPAYASPEQILGGSITTATDQFSLGVVLYELLTREKPFRFEGRSFEEIARSADSAQADPPSRIISGKTQRLSSDLDNIVLKCLRREPERRYDSVAELSADIERFLDGRPVAARPSTFSYLASRFIARNKLAVGATLVVLLSVVAGLAVALWQADVANAERDRAERRFAEVRQLTNALLFEIAPKIDRLPGSTEARELLVSRGLSYLDSLAAESRSDEKLQAELADAYQKIGDIQGNPTKPNLSDFVGAIASYEKSRSILQTLPQTRENRMRLAAAARELARIHSAQREVGATLRDSETAIAIYRSLIAEESSDVGLMLSLIATEIDHAHEYATNNQYDVAIPMYREIVARLDGLGDGLETLRLKALASAYLSNGLSWDGKQDLAEAENERAVGFADRLASAAEADTRVRRTTFEVYSLASSTFETIKNDVSLDFAEKALSVARKAADADPYDTQAKQDLAKAVSRKGILLTLIGRTEAGFEQLKRSERALLELIEREPRNIGYLDDLGTLYTRFGDAEKQRNDLTATLAAYRRSADVFGKLAADEKNLVAQRDYAQSLKSVGVTEIKLGLKGDARATILKAIGIVESLKQRNALGKWDEMIFDEMPSLLAKLGD
ncbi:MAG: serine/threonine protein kinase [Chloracidobacterium sp.]|nr:serine/threonine protein kinase [Chloracidobacterium sp.]